MMGNIYKLIVDDKFYIGSTKLKLPLRMSLHISNSKHRDSKICDYIKEKGKDKISIELIEVCPLDTMLEREKHYIHELLDDNCLNTIKNPVRTLEEKKEQDKINNAKPEIREAALLRKREATKIRQEAREHLPPRPKLTDDPDYHKKRWKEWADKNREHLREQYKIQDEKRR